MIISRIKIYDRDIATKTAWYWHKRHGDKRNRIEEPETNPHNSHLIFDKGDKTCERKDNLLNILCWENWALSCRR